MNTIFALVAKDLQVFWKDKVAVVVSFLVPMALITIFGFIFGGSGSGPSGIRLLVVDEAASEASAKLVETLREEDSFRVLTGRRVGEETVPLDRESARSLLNANASSYRYALILPTDLVSEEFGLQIELFYNPQNAVENNIVQGILQKVLFSRAFPLLLENQPSGLSESGRDAFNSELAGVIGKHFGVDPADVLDSFGPDPSDPSDLSGSPDSSDFLSSLIQMEKTQVFGKNKNPAAQSVGGWAVMFLLFSLSGAATSLFEERDRGLFLRILSGPATRFHILWSKYVFCALLGLSQMLVLLAFGELVFDIVTSVSQLLPLLVISGAAAAAATAFGMLLASLAKTPAQANGLGTFLILGLSAFGGAMFPLFMIPEFIRTYLSPFSLVYWAMDGILAVLWRDAGVTQILPQTAVLLLFAGVVLLIALWRFGRGDLFR